MVLGFRFGVWSIEFRDFIFVSELWVLGFKLLILNFGLRVLAFGFTVSGLGSMVQD
jgi:hypothetical protein